MKKMMWFAVVLILISQSFSQTYISGPINGEVEWNLTGSPYIITGSTIILSEASLNINPGVHVLFQSEASLIIGSGGELIANGTEQDSIKFGLAAGDTSFLGIIFNEGAIGATLVGDTTYVSGSLFNFCIFEGLRASEIISTNFASTSLFFSNSNFVSCSPGGRILDVYGSVTILNCIFSRNSGGLIGGTRNIKIIGSSFTENAPFDPESSNAWLIAVQYGDSVLIFDSDFSHNVGGTISACMYDNSTFQIEACTFSNNSNINGSIGGVNQYVCQGANFIDVRILNSQFTNNEGGYNAGALRLNPRDAPAIISNSSFIQNYGRYGALYIGGTGIVIESSIFRQNEGSGSGGAIKFSVTDSVLINNSQFTENSSVCDGGALMFEADMYSYISNSNFFNNESSEGSGSAIFGTGNVSIELDSCSFINNIVVDTSTIVCDMMHDSATPKATLGGAAFSGSNNNFAHNYGLYAIRMASGGTEELNLENNYWGVMDSSAVDSLVFDLYDDPSFNTYLADIYPFSAAPIAELGLLPVHNFSVAGIGSDFVIVDWDSSANSEVIGYKLYYDSDEPGEPYSNSIDLGNTIQYTLNELMTFETYYLTMTCYDANGNESWYSNEIEIEAEPSPIINVSEIVVDFGSVMVGDTSQSFITLTNTGTAELQVNDIAWGSTELAISPQSFTVAEQQSALIDLTVVPRGYGQRRDTLIVSNNSYNNPTLTIDVQWFGDLPESPTIISVDDIPDDQGGQIRVSFARSKYDGYDESQEITSYSIWRHIEGENWDGIGMFNAVQDSIYNFVAPTLCDSSGEGVCWSSFKVSAHTSDAEVYYFSDSLGGYSVDNIAPGIPGNLLAVRFDGGVQLSWSGVSESDFQYFAIYRSTQSGFNPDTMDTHNYTTIDTVLMDNDLEEPGTYYYRISAFDYAGNESEYSEQVSATIVSIASEIELPTEYVLDQNFPNPFNPSTTIRYGLPGDSEVSLTIYDIRGNTVRTINSGSQVAGWYERIWNGMDDSGVPVSTGLYLTRLHAGSYSKVIKMLYLK